MADLFRRALLVLCVLLPATTFAQLKPQLEEEEHRSWIETEVRLPAFPKPENLIRFVPSAASDNQFFVDAQSISVGNDGVVRYTLVVKGRGGGENISYEGIRCETREQRPYAFGRRDGSWSNARSAQWKRIEYREINGQHGALYADYFCPDRKIIKTAKDAINRLKYGGPRSGE